MPRRGLHPLEDVDAKGCLGRCNRPHWRKAVAQTVDDKQRKRGLCPGRRKQTKQSTGDARNGCRWHCLGQRRQHVAVGVWSQCDQAVNPEQQRNERKLTCVYDTGADEEGDEQTISLIPGCAEEDAPSTKQPKLQCDCVVR